MRRHPSAHAPARLQRATTARIHRERRARRVHGTGSALLLLFVAPLAHALDVGDLLKINEVHYDPAEVPQSTHEFIELYNAGTSTVHLDGAVITDEGNNGSVEATFQFPGTRGGTTLPVAPGEFVLLVPDALGSPYTGIDFEFFAGGMDTDDPSVPNLVKTSGLASNLTLANGGDGVTLSIGLTSGNIIPCPEIVDGVSWESGGTGDVTALSDSICADPAPHPGAGSGTNSLQRCSDGFDSDDGSADFLVAARTPGAQNTCPEAPVLTDLTYAPCVPGDAEPVTLSVVVTDSNGDIATVRAFFKSEQAALFDSLDMTAVNDSAYAVSLPGKADQTLVHFYAQATDSTGLVQVEPSSAPGAPASYRVGIVDIVSIQSSTSADSCLGSTFAGKAVNVRGTVTHAAAEFDNCYFFIQQDTLPNSGIRVFVADSSFVPGLGDSVTVSGTVSEFRCQTQVEMFPGCSSVEDTGRPVLARTLGSVTDIVLEENEGMLVTVPGPIPVLTGFIVVIVGNEVFLEFGVGSAPNTVWVGNDTFEPDGVGYSIIPEPALILDALTGIVAWRQPDGTDSTSVLKLEPRRDNDVDRNWTGVPERDDVAVVTSLRLDQNRPNPFNPVTTIEFDMPRAGRAELSIFDARGVRVRQLVARRFPAAARVRTVWDGTDDGGRAVPSGLYLYRLEAAGLSATRKMLLLR